VKLTYAAYAKAKDFSCLGGWCLLCGPEPHLRRAALGRMREEVLAAGGPGTEAVWETLEGAGLSARDLLGRSQTLGLFGGARGLVVQQAERMDRKVQEELAKAVAPLPAEIGIVLVTGETGDRRAKKLGAKLLKAIEERGMIVDCPEMKAPEAANWALQHARALGKSLEPAAARKLTEQFVGTGLGDLSSEIEKLVAYTGDRSIITSADVDEVTPRLLEEDVFRLIDAVANQSTGRAVAILRSLLQDGRDKPERLLPMLATALREIWQTKLLVERGWRQGRELDDETKAMLPRDERKNVLKVFARRSFLISRRMAQAKVFTWARLARAMQALHSCDLAMKGISGTVEDKEVALELAVVQLCTDLAMPVWEARTGEARLG
jgi:DNA polymerase III subunit delta